MSVLLDSHISYLLHEHNCVILPAFGGFVANYHSSRIDPIINLIKKNNRLHETYSPKCWGPTSSFDLIKRHGFEWCEPHY